MPCLGIRLHPQYRAKSGGSQQVAATDRGLFVIYCTTIGCSAVACDPTVNTSRPLNTEREAELLVLGGRRVSLRERLGEDRLPGHDMAGHQRFGLVLQLLPDDLDDTVMFGHGRFLTLEAVG